MTIVSMPDECIRAKVDVSVLRQVIDDIDKCVIDLLHARRYLSQQVQRTRSGVGGPRIDSVREGEIIKTYRVSFGDAGNALAAALLMMCRG